MIESMKEVRKDGGFDSVVSVGIPALDAAMPATLETATFALG